MTTSPTSLQILHSRHVSLGSAVSLSVSSSLWDDWGLLVLELSGEQQETIIVSEDCQLRDPPEQPHPQDRPASEAWRPAECLQ